MECRAGCGACCIAISISSPLPDMPAGKPAGTRCTHLKPDRTCAIHGSRDYPEVCAALRPDVSICGEDFREAMALLETMEEETTPASGKEKVELRSYDPQWPLYFSQEKELLENIFPEVFRYLHHIGSTSVPGLTAKPVIDIMGVTDSVSELDDHELRFKEWGYRCCGENGIPGRRFYIKKNADYKIHLHVFADEDANIRRHLVFRDYLMIHPAEAENYVSVKKSAAEKHPDDSTAYHAEKSDFVKALEQRALAYFKDQGAEGKVV